MDLSQFVPTTVQWWEVLLAIIIVVAGWIGSRFARRGVLALMRRAPGIPPGLASFASHFAQYGILLLGIGIGLTFLGADIQPLLAMTLVVAVVALLVLRGVADNFAAGVLLQARHPVKLGEEVTIEGPEGPLTGKIIELNSRSVVFLTVDGRTVHVPNGRFIQEPIVNDSEHGARRSEVQVRVQRSAGDGVTEVLALLAKAAGDAEGVHSREKPRALAVTVSPSRLTARVQFWHHPLHVAPVTSAVIVALVGALEAAALTATVTSMPGDPPLVPPDDV